VTRVRAALAGGLAAALLCVSGASAATAPITNVSVDPSHYPTVRFTVKTAKPGQPPTLTVLENGQQATGVTLASGGSSVAIALALDTSTSMQGKPLVDAIAAAQTFVAGLAPGTDLAVYGFGSKSYVGSPFSTDSSSAVTALGQLGTNHVSGTAIYSAVEQASADLAQEPASRHVLVLLTDGTSVGEKATLAQAVAAAKAAGVTIYTVATSANSDTASLQQMASGTGGQMVQAGNSAALKSAYKQISDTLGSTFTYAYQSLVPRGRPIHLSVSVGSSAPLTASAMAPGKYVAPPAPSSGLIKLPSSPAGRAVVAMVAGLFVLLAALVVLSSKPAVIVAKRIAPHTEQRRQVVVAGVGEVPKITMLHQLYVATEKVAGSLNYWKRMTYRLEQANLPLRTAEIVYIQMVSGILVGAIGTLFFGLALPFNLIPLAIGATLPVLYVKFKAKRRMNLFENQLPETLITLAASLKAGHAFNSALSSVVKEGAEPTSTELARVSSEIQLGMSSEVALEAMAQRMNSTNFGFVVMAVNIQRTVGGSLADILDMVADTVRQRQQFTRKVKALTAQGRMSAYTLLAMPFLMGLAIFALNHSYMNLLFTTSMGQIMIVAALVMMGIGGVIIQKIVSFKG
jgi:tight adherence protein B